MSGDVDTDTCGRTDRNDKFRKST